MEDNPYVVIGEGDQASVVVEGDARVEIVEGVGAATLLDLTSIKERISLLDRPKTTNWKRALDYRITVPTLLKPDGSRRPIMLHVIIGGQSLGPGTGSTMRYRTMNPRGVSALMLRLGDGSASFQGPWTAGQTINSVLIPLVESDPSRVNPEVEDPVSSDSVTQGPGKGETPASGLVDTMLDMIEASGINLSIVRICATIVAIGGQRFDQLGPGTLSDLWMREAITAGAKAAEAEGYGYTTCALIFHGQADAQANADEGFDEASSSLDKTEHEYASYLIQWRARFADAARECSGINIDPYFFVVQNGSTIPAQWRHDNRRLANIAQGQIIASQRDPKIVISGVEYTEDVRDGAHKFEAGYYNMGANQAEAIARTIFGNGRFRPSQAIGARALSPTRARVTVDAAGGDLRIQRYGINEFTIASGGVDYQLGDEISVNGLKVPARVRVTAIGPSGVVTALELIDPGTSDTEISGILTAQAQITSAKLISPGTGTPVRGNNATPIGGTYTTEARFQIDFDEAGNVIFVLINPGVYTKFPTSPVMISTPQVIGMTAMLYPIGSGLTINARSYSKFCHTLRVPVFNSTGINPAPVITAGGSGYLDRDIAEAVGGELGVDGFPASIDIASRVGTAISSARLRTGGVYRARPANPVEFRSATGAGCFITVPWSSLVTDPGTCGIEVEDESLPMTAGFGTRSGVRPPRVVEGSIVVVNDGMVNNTAIEFDVDQPFGRDTRIMIGQHVQRSGDGSAYGGRTLFASPPPHGSKAGKCGVMPQAWLVRGGVDLPTPAYQVFAVPPLDNTRFTIDQEGAAAGVTLTSAGVYPVDRWRGYRSAAGSTAKRTSGNREKYALRIQRDVGNTSIAQIQITQVVVGEAARAFRGKPVLIGFGGMRKGVDAGGTMVIRLYTHSMVTNYTAAGIPSGATQLFFRGLALTTDWMPQFVGSAEDGYGNDVLVPDTAEVIVLLIAYTPAATLAGTDDWIEFEEPSLNTGTVPRDFNPQSESEEWHRCALWYRRPVGGLYVGTTPTVYSLDPPMRTVPTVSGGGPGFSSANTTNSALVVSQTTAGVQPLVLSARL